MNSHITIPKCVLKNFTNPRGKIYSYDLCKKSYGEVTPSDFNTGANYYSIQMEIFLGGNIEKEVGYLIKDLKANFSNEKIILRGKHEKTIRNYICALYSRNTKFHADIKNSLLPQEQELEQMKNDFLAYKGFELVQIKFSQYYVSCMFIIDNSEFILTSDGQFCIEFEKDKCKQEYIIAPITTKIALCLSREEVDHEIIPVDKEVAKELARFSIQSQIEHEYGCILSSDKLYLENMIKFYFESKSNEKQRN